MKAIPIEQLREQLVYDAETGSLYEKSSGRQMGNPSKGYLKVSINGVSLSAHRVIWAMYYGEWPKVQVDHIDQNRANNRIDNLRLATNSQNNMNVGARGAIASKGVTWDAKRAKFRAQIKVNGISRSIGYFATEDQAAHAYNKEAIRLHGEFAVLNPIGNGVGEEESLLDTLLAAPSANISGWVIEGASAAGDRHGAAKLTKEQVLIIREAYAARKKYQWGAARLARAFGVSERAVQLAATSGTWQRLVKDSSASPASGSQEQGAAS